MKHEMIPVEPGQIWADNDKRNAGRTLRVKRIDGEYAVCVIETNDDATQKRLDALNGGTLEDGWYRPKDRVGRETRVMLRRFKPTTTGYRLVS